MSAAAQSDLAVTLLYVPADRPDRVAKALALDADVVIVDLEDAVAPAAKERARAAVPELLASRGAARVQVRVNARDTPWAAEDLAMVSGLDPEVEVRLPKVEAAADLDAATESLGTDRRLHCLIETAVGIEHAYDIARGSRSVASIALGEADLRSELGISDERGLGWARGRIVVAAIAAGLAPPAQSVFADVRDLDGLAESTRAGAALGFVGRQAIHPAQLPVIRAAYRPEPEAVRGARGLLERFAAAQAAGSGVTVLDDGTFVDTAMVAGARRVLDLEARTRDPR